MRVLRNVLFALIPAALLLGIFALGFLGEPENDPWLNASPLWGPGDPFFAVNPANAHNLADPVLIWRGRPDFEATYTYLVENHYRHNEYGFRDDPVAVPKPPDTIRVLDVGDSSTWGLNLPDRSATYSDQLQALLDARPDGPRYDVVNAGVVGYSSFQGLQLVRHWLDDLDADVVTVYLGNNDPAPGSVRDADRVAATTGPLQEILLHNRFYLLLNKAFLTLRASTIQKARIDLQGQPKNQSRADYYRTSVRVSPRSYEDNLREIVKLVRAEGARPILIKVPMNILWPLRVQPYAEQVLRPDRFWITVKIEPGYLVRQRAGRPACFQGPLEDHPYLCRISSFDLRKAHLPGRHELSRQAADPARSERERLWARHNAAVWRMADGDVAGARTEFEAVAEAAERCGCVEPKQLAWVHYNVGVTRLLQGEREAAFRALVRARATWPFAMSPDYSEAFDRVVRDLDVDWVDGQTLFRQADPEFGGSALIHDWVHPNRRGNAVLARGLAKRLEALEQAPGRP